MKSEIELAAAAGTEGFTGRLDPRAAAMRIGMPTTSPRHVSEMATPATIAITRAQAALLATPTVAAIESANNPDVG